jgi:hypothetical protein
MPSVKACCVYVFAQSSFDLIDLSYPRLITKDEYLTIDGIE